MMAMIDWKAKNIAIMIHSACENIFLSYYIFFQYIPDINVILAMNPHLISSQWF